MERRTVAKKFCKLGSTKRNIHIYNVHISKTHSFVNHTHGFLSQSHKKCSILLFNIYKFLQSQQRFTSTYTNGEKVENMYIDEKF